MLLILLLCLWAIYSTQSWIGSSEFWPITVSGYWNEIWKAQSLLYKPLFYLFLSPIYLMPISSAAHIFVVKFLMSFVGFYSLVLIYKKLRLDSSQNKILLLFFVLMGSQIFLTQFGRIRSDFLAILVFAYGFYKLAEDEKMNRPHDWRPIKCLLFSLAIVAITPKAIPAAIINLIMHFKISELSKKSKPIFYLVLGTALLVFGLIITKMGEGLFALISFVKASVQYPEKLENLIQHINLMPNVAIFIIVAVMVFETIKDSFKRNLDDRWKLISFVVIAILSLVFIQPLLPFYLLFILVLVLIVFSKGLNFLSRKVLATLACLNIYYIVLNPSSYFSTLYVQLESISKIENELKKIKPNTVFDGLGIIPRLPNTLNYIGPNDPEALKWAEHTFINTFPEFIIFTARISNLSSDTINIVQRNYRSVGSGYWLRNDISEEIDLKTLPTAIALFDLENKTLKNISELDLRF